MLIHTDKSIPSSNKNSSRLSIDLFNKDFTSSDSWLNVSNTASDNTWEWKRETKILLSLIRLLIPTDRIAMHFVSWILNLPLTSFQSLKVVKMSYIRTKPLWLLFLVSKVLQDFFLPLGYRRYLHLLFFQYSKDSLYAILQLVHLKSEEHQNNYESRIKQWM